MDRNTPTTHGSPRACRVATREGGVDRNVVGPEIGRGGETVATREGGVDRNARLCGGNNAAAVATREGGVDRNDLPQIRDAMTQTSPPPRVAWIETTTGPTSTTTASTVATREGGVDRNYAGWRYVYWTYVATREGGVDRNGCYIHHNVATRRSPPARVAWIETSCPIVQRDKLRCRHPRGWRG